MFNWKIGRARVSQVREENTSLKERVKTLQDCIDRLQAIVVEIREQNADLVIRLRSKNENAYPSHNIFAQDGLVDHD